MKLWRFILAALLVSGAYILVKLPGPQDARVQNYQTLSEFNNLPDYDFRSEAVKLWESGEEEAAVLLLEQIITNDWPDKEAASQLLQSYTESLEAGDSSLGRIKSFGGAFITGRVNSFEELAGASLADFFLYGDVRDLTRELVFENEKSTFIIAVSSLGILTTAFPPADPLASLLKTSYKTNSLAEPMVKHIIKVLEPLKKGTAKVSIATLKTIVAELKPIWELAASTKSWQQFSLFMKHCSNTSQVKFITKVVSKPGNGNKLAALLSTLRSLPKRSSEMLAHIHKYGQKGMDSLYAVYRKGPAGIQFIMKNPALYTRLAKNSFKGAELTSKIIDRSWSDLLSKYGAPVNIMRYLLAAVLLFLLKPLFWGKKKKNNEAVLEKPALPNKNLNWMMVVIGLMAVSFFFSGSNSYSTVSSGSQIASSGSVKSSSIIFFILFSIVQIWAVYKAKNEMDEIRKVTGNDKKIKLLENSEFYFDLPVYAGLAGTVSAFILLSYDPGGSRILAYATTISGILISVFLRGKWLFPARKEIIHGERNE